MRLCKIDLIIGWLIGWSETDERVRPALTLCQRGHYLVQLGGWPFDLLYCKLMRQFWGSILNVEFCVVMLLAIPHVKA